LMARRAKLVHEGQARERSKTYVHCKKAAKLTGRRVSFGGVGGVNPNSRGNSNLCATRL